MGTYARQLVVKTVGVFLAALLAMVAAATPFNALTFDWGAALTVAGSTAVLALLEGLAGRFTGDRDQASVTR
jgi:ABC-type phosphate transport system substrate-binding protein